MWQIDYLEHKEVKPANEFDEIIILLCTNYSDGHGFDFAWIWKNRTIKQSMSQRDMSILSWVGSSGVFLFKLTCLGWLWTKITLGSKLSFHNNQTIDVNASGLSQIIRVYCPITNIVRTSVRNPVVTQYIESTTWKLVVGFTYIQFFAWLSHYRN